MEHYMGNHILEFTTTLFEVVTAFKEYRKSRLKRLTHPPGSGTLSTVYKRAEPKTKRNILHYTIQDDEDNIISNLLKITKHDFEHLFAMLKLKLEKNTVTRVDPRACLVVTLMYLVTGDALHRLGQRIKMSCRLLRKVIPIVCAYLIEGLHEYVRLPSTTDGWLRIAKEFENKWLFPHALGAIAGRHIGVRCPKGSDVTYVNYALFSSIVLMAVVDANSNFLYVEVGRKGNTSNVDPFQHSKLCHMLDNNMLNVPEPAVLQVPYTLEIPYMLLADEGFSNTSHRLTPFSQTEDGEECAMEHGFNVRHALARMPVDNAMSIMISRFCVLRGTMELYPPNAAKVVAACVYLHNFLLTRESRAMYAPPEAFDRVIDETIVAGEWRENEQIKSVLNLQDMPDNVPDTLKQLRLHMAYHFQHNDSQVVEECASSEG